MFFGFFDEVDYDANNDGKGCNHGEDKPHGADDEVLSLGGDGAVIIEGLLDIDDAESGEVIDVARDGTGGIGENQFGKTIFDAGFREDGFASDGVLDGDGDSGFVVDVAGVVKSGADGDRNYGGETRNVI